MPISLPPLPYAADALAPAISRATLEVHHGKHHKAYVDKTNALTKDGPLADASLEEIVRQAHGRGDQALFNQAAQAWNHGFYWRSLQPVAAVPPQVLERALVASFGTVADFVDAFLAEAAKHFGSGWAWLVAEGEALRIETTHDAGCPIVAGLRPLLVLDVWEHAYYLDRKNDRKAYLDAAGQLLAWDFAAENLEREGVWTYPS